MAHREGPLTLRPTNDHSQGTGRTLEGNMKCASGADLCYKECGIKCKRETKTVARCLLASRNNWEGKDHVNFPSPRNS